VFNPASLAFVGEIGTGGQAVSTVAPLAGDRALAFCWDKGVWQMDLRAMTGRALDPMAVTVNSVTCAPDGTIYAAAGSQLYRVTP